MFGFGSTKKLYERPAVPSNSSAEPLEEPEDARPSSIFSVACGAGWPAYWMMCIFCGAALMIDGQVVPGLGLRYFNGWHGDPCAGVGNESPDCQEASASFVKARSTFSLAGQVLALVATPIGGMLSDSLGRKPFLLVNLCFVFTGSLALAAINFMHASIYLVLWNVLLCNISPFQVMTWGWILDNTQHHDRIPLFGLLNVMSEAEGILSPFAGIFLGDGALIVFASTVACIAVVLCLCFLPESLPSKKRQPLKSPVNVVYGSFASLPEALSNPGLRPLLFTTVAFAVGRFGLARNFLIFMQERFGVDRQGASPILLTNGIISLFTQLFLLKPINDAGGPGLVIGVGMAFVVVAHSTFPFFNLPLCWVSMILDGFGAMVNGAVLGLLGNLCPISKRGALTASFNVLMNVSVAGCVFVFDRLHVYFASPNHFFDHPFPAAPLLVCVIFELAGIVCLASSWGNIKEAMRAVEESDANLSHQRTA